MYVLFVRQILFEQNANIPIQNILTFVGLKHALHFSFDGVPKMFQYGKIRKKVNILWKILGFDDNCFH